MSPSKTSSSFHWRLRSPDIGAGGAHRFGGGAFAVGAAVFVELFALAEVGRFFGWRLGEGFVERFFGEFEFAGVGLGGGEGVEIAVVFVAVDLDGFLGDGDGFVGFAKAGRRGRWP